MDELIGQGFFLVSSGAENRPFSQWDLGDYFPQFEKKNPNLKKKLKKIFRIFIQSPHTHKLHGDNLLSLQLIFLQFRAIVSCIMANLFLN